MDSQHRMTRISLRAVLALTSALVLALACILACAGCSSSQSQSSTGSQSQSVTIGTLATEDFLPMWAAEQDGIFKDNGIDVNIVTFQSATELIAGISSGEVDMAMTDPMVAASITQSGTPLELDWVTLGTTASQGRFGIMVGPDSNIDSIQQLAGVPIGVGTNTILEYVMDNLMSQAGIPSDQIVVEEIQKLPVRYQSMQSGEVAAAMLPNTLLALGEANGCKIIADDTTGANLSQSVMVSRVDFADSADGKKCIEEVSKSWNTAVDAINANPDSYRSLLAENANLSDQIASSYQISEYPQAQRPTSDMVDPILTWMTQKGYLTTPLTYDATTGRFVE